MALMLSIAASPAHLAATETEKLSPAHPAQHPTHLQNNYAGHSRGDVCGGVKSREAPNEPGPPSLRQVRHCRSSGLRCCDPDWASDPVALGGRMSVADKLPACFLADLIHAQMSTGNFGRMASAAISWAKQNRRDEDAQLFANLQQQVADYFAQSRDDGTIHIAFRPE